MNKHTWGSILLAVMIALSLGAVPALAQGDDSVDRPEGWDEYSHGKSTDPDYAVVFPQDTVNTLTIQLDPEEWQGMLDNMTGLYGEFGSSDGGGFGGQMPGGQMPGGQRPENGQWPGGGQPGGFDPNATPPDMPEGMQAPDMGQRPDGMGPGHMGGMGMMLDSTENPDWFAADVTFNGTTWTNVGLRFKGNSSLMSTWGSGIYKLPFKLDFDEFEDEYPEIDNQRFYGFKQLSFSSNWSDSSLLREKVTADVFREAGVPAAQTAFYAVYVDYGEGPVYFGLYTAVEVVDDTVIATQFADDSGNVYKPEGTGATFAEGSFDEESFDKETNEDEADYSDILALFEALHADTRTTDPEIWRAGLEAVFDVDGFVHWLAVNVVVQNWDTYGQMAHNYYLYTDPTSGLITWIPWDNNMAMMAGMGGGFGGGADRQFGGRDGGMGGMGGSIDIDLEEVGDSWPLIRYLMDDPVYHALYVQYVDDTIQGAFEPARMTATFQTLHDLIAPYVVGENGEQPDYSNLNAAEDFETALTALIEHVNTRYSVAQEYVSSQTTSVG